MRSLTRYIIKSEVWSILVIVLLGISHIALDPTEAKAQPSMETLKEALEEANTAVAQAKLAVETVENALAEAQRLFLTSTGGIALSSQTNVTLYQQIDLSKIKIYQKYNDFDDEWVSNDWFDKPGNVQLALVTNSDQNEPEEFYLFHIDPLDMGEAAEWTGWSEYTLITSGEDMQTNAITRKYIESPRKNLSEAIPFGAGTTTIEESLENLRVKRNEKNLLNDYRFDKLLLVDKSDAQSPDYTLIIFNYEGPPAPGDNVRNWCANCQSCWCCGWCWWWGIPTSFNCTYCY